MKLTFNIITKVRIKRIRIFSNNFVILEYLVIKVYNIRVFTDKSVIL